MSLIYPKRQSIDYAYRSMYYYLKLIQLKYYYEFHNMAVLRLNHISICEVFFEYQSSPKEIRANIPDAKITDNLATIIVRSLKSKNDNQPIELGIIAKRNNGMPNHAHRNPPNP